MCGIIAYLVKQASEKLVFETLYNGLYMVENRGYDSAGLGAIKDGSIIIKKFATRSQTTALNQLKDYKLDFENCMIGIAHTRWATHGPKTDENAHPHADYYNQFVLVHNGLIENYMELRQVLVQDGYLFRSETDSEVIVNLISYHYRKEKNVNKAITQTIQQLQGTWALAILSLIEQDTLYLCKNGSPLLLGFNEDQIMATSEVVGFCNLMREYIILDNKDLIGINFKNFDKINFKRYKIHTLQETKIDLTPFPFQHWMIKEIEEQPQSLIRAFNYGGRIESKTNVKLGGLDVMKKKIIGIKNLIILACGTSLYAGYYGSHWLKQLQCFNTVTIIDASEFNLYDLPQKNPGVLVISQSGETIHVHRAIELIRRTQTPIISIINVVDSSISHEADCGIYLNAGREVGVASTKSFTSQCVVIALIGLWFAQNRSINIDKRKTLIQSITRLPDQCMTIIDQYKNQCQQLARVLTGYEHCFILGSGALYPIALEGALKLKKIGYIHAEGFCGGTLKHGPLALIGSNSPVIILSDTETKTQMESAIKNIKSRNSQVIVISNHEINRQIDYHILIHSDNILISLLYTLIFQLTAYNLSILKGNDPDHPRNLAKVVTIDG